jgi:hypothetical protein
MPTPLTHLLKPRCPATDLRLRCGLLAIEARGDLLGSEDGLCHVTCAGCLRDLLIDMRLALYGLGDSPAARWLAGGDAGVSSKTIWAVMTGYPIPNEPRLRAADPPQDPSDFGRCHRLLELFPAWRSRMPEVALAHPDWAGLVAEWDALTELYVTELPTGEAPLLYARMKELLGS